MLRFGPAGNSESFYAAGYKSSFQAPGWLASMGLSAYEYSFGRGIGLSMEAAERIAGEAKIHNIAMSAHAPYFINLSNPDPEKRENSFRYITDSAKLVTALGGDRVVVHVGAMMKLTEEEALKNCSEGLKEVCLRLDDMGLSHIHLCPEVMGKKNQIGDLSQTLNFCLLDQRFIPCIDFAHLHARGQGTLKGTEDFAKALDELEAALGICRARQLHIHFSAIEYTAAGEKRHRTFADTEYGPYFAHLAPLLKERGYEGRVICESRGTMAEDAKTMKEIYESM